VWFRENDFRAGLWPCVHGRAAGVFCGGGNVPCPGHLQFGTGHGAIAVAASFRRARNYAREGPVNGTFKTPASLAILIKHYGMCVVEYIYLVCTCEWVVRMGDSFGWSLKRKKSSCTESEG
jgi:hypothetical protein